MMPMTDMMFIVVAGDEHRQQCAGHGWRQREA